MELDLTRATRVYGSSRAAWFQEGHYFNREGQLIDPSEAAKPAEGDVIPQTATVAPAPMTVATAIETIAPALATVPEYVAVVDKPVEREPEDRNWGGDKYLKLKALKTTVLAAMVMKAGGTPSTGLGAKKKNIEWLMANVKG